MQVGRRGDGPPARYGVDKNALGRRGVRVASRPIAHYILQAGSGTKNNQIGLCQHRGDASGPTSPPLTPLAPPSFAPTSAISSCICDPRVTSGTPPAAWWPQWDSSFLELAPYAVEQSTQMRVTIPAGPL